jgi:hypothetical protein
MDPPNTLIGVVSLPAYARQLEVSIASAVPARRVRKKSIVVCNLIGQHQAARRCGRAGIPGHLCPIRALPPGGVI